MKLLFSIILFLTAFNAISQSANERTSRDSFTLKMPVSKETYYETHIQSSPFVVGPKILQLFPGESVFIEVEQKDGLITDIKSVRENTNKNKTLEISFRQNVENDKHADMVLKVKNPFKQDLSYEATIRLMKTEKWVSTSIIPVKAGLVGVEMWPDVIISIALSELKFL